GNYWIEFWYRENVMNSINSFNGHVHIYFNSDRTPPTYTMGTLGFDRSYGQWRKLGFRMNAPPITQDGKISFTIRHAAGVVELDGLSIREVSDRDNDAINNFF